MKLKRILLTLSFLAFVSALLSCWFYYLSLKRSTLKDANYQAEVRVEMLSRHLGSYFSENIKPVKALSRMPPLRNYLESRTRSHLMEANQVLDNYADALGLEAAYLMDLSGITLASSNRKTPESFVGKDFSFRPYFKRGVEGQAVNYLALGVTSMRRGAYCSHPVYSEDGYRILGVVVLKVSIEQVERDRLSGLHEAVFVIDPHGMIFISNRSSYLYTLFNALPSDSVEGLAASRQFGEGPWGWSGFQFNQKGELLDVFGYRYLLNRASVPGFKGWEVLHLRSLSDISELVFAPLIRTTTWVVVMLSACIGALIVVLYRMASLEIRRRVMAEGALRDSEKRYRSIYHHTPAMLHSINREGKLITVSDFWLEWTGYSRPEVIGRPLTDFFTEASRERAETQVLPTFFREGVVRNIPYQFVRRDGSLIDILTSGYGLRNEAGEVERSIAVSVDVTDRNRARRALEAAKEKLSHYSRELEVLVRKRTKEITAIFEHTPALIYVKNPDGTFRLVNTFFEKIFSVTASKVVGLSAHEVLPRRVADQFTTHDQRVIEENRVIQVTEWTPGAKGRLTWLSTKFPFYHEDGSISGICSVSTDVTELQQTQDQLRSLSGSIMASQERERASMARELHDELGQVLTVLRMDAVWLERRLSSGDAEGTTRAASMRQLVDKTIEDVRSMAYRLRPVILDDLGLVAALESLVADFEAHTGVASVCRHTGAYEEREGVSTAVYRIVQEALTNVARHAQACRVDVTLHTGESGLTVTIVDNGAGFDAEEKRHTGFGLTGMTERAALAGGSLSISSELDKGTTITCTIPFLSPLNGERPV